MARRSPMNNRYQKGTTPKGVARKSAASAKPKRAAGDGPISSADAKKGRRGRAKAAAASNGQKKGNTFLREMPDTPEYKQQRRIWWYCLGAAFILLIASLAIGQEFVYSALGLSAATATTSIGFPMTIMAMFLVGLAWYIDLRKIRPMMKEFEAAKAGKKAKADKGADKDTDKDAAVTDADDDGDGADDDESDADTDKK